MGIGGKLRNHLRTVATGRSIGLAIAHPNLIAHARSIVGCRGPDQRDGATGVARSISGFDLLRRLQGLLSEGNRRDVEEERKRRYDVPWKTNQHMGQEILQEAHPSIISTLARGMVA